MAKRTGVPSLIKFTQRVCDLITSYGNVIKILYPTNTALHAALDTALVACAALNEELLEVRDTGD